MKKTLHFFSRLLIFMVSSATLMAMDAVSPLKVLYIGNRAGDFVPWLKTHFAQTDPVTREKFQPAQAQNYDVVLLDWPQSGAMRGAWLDGSPLGKREEWGKPTVLLGSAGLNLAVAWKLYGGSGCTCLAPVAYAISDHEIFRSPMEVDLSGLINIPTPEQYAHELKTNVITVLPLVDNIRQYRTVIRDYQPGWSTHYYEFADMPDVEEFCGGINEQTPRSRAFWRQGNLLHFGFQQSPTELNANGRAMLLNAIVYISRFTQDRPIGITPSVFGPDKIAVTRKRAEDYFANYPREVARVISADTLAMFDWHNATNARAWFESQRPWIHPNAENLLELDARAKSLRVVFDSPDFFPKTITALREEKTATTAAALLARYAPDGPGNEAGADDWQKWWRENSAYLFYSELGGYRWYLDPLAKKRGIPSAQLRGPRRADVINN